MAVTFPLSYLVDSTEDKLTLLSCRFVRWTRRCRLPVRPLRAMKTITTCLFVAVAMFAFAAGKFVDDQLAAKAEVVLRVKRLTPGEGSKYLWYRVKVLQVLKNQSNETFTNTLSVAAYSWKDGVPEGESTLYLERYNKTDKGLWKLLDGEASTGVSHARKP